MAETNALGIGLTFALAAFVHATAGFGSALIAMAILVPLIGLSVTAPLVALISLPLQIFLVWRYSDQFSFKSVRALLVTILIGTPIGIWGLAWLNEDILLTLLGTIILAYVVYTALGKQHFLLDGHPRWTLLFGLSSGILNGAYNSGGALVVMYFKSRGYPPDEFRANVQTTFIVATLIVVASHFVQRNITGEVLSYYTVALFGMSVGLSVGLRVARYINQAMFHWLVLGLLALLGVNLLLT